MPTVAIHDLARLGAAERAALLQRSESDLGPFLDGARPIIEAVRVEGDGALARLTPHVAALAEAEGLPAHAESVRLRGRP